MDIDYRKLAESIVDELEERGLLGEDDVIPVAKYAYEKGVDRSTVYRRAERNGIPIRDETGAVRDGEGVACVSRTEMEMKEDLGTRVVRRADGQYD
jgi:hypothetical protein